MTLSRTDLVAPCGLDCRLCQRYSRKKNPCPGCRGDDCLKLPSCLNCKIKNCPYIKSGKLRFCHECREYPCGLVKRLDRRYKKSYGLSILKNLDRIKTVGVSQFVSEQGKDWSCSACGEVLCMHKPGCISCGQVQRKSKIA